MRIVKLMALAGLLALGAAVAPPGDWSTADLSYIGKSDHAFSSTRAVCAQLIHANPPAADRPTRAEAKALEGCDSEALYYGIGIPADPVAARKCAMVEGNRNDQPLRLHHQQGLLMMVYANGRGAARDLDVAIHLACQLGDAAAAMDGRIKHLVALRRSGPADKAFDSCDDITSGVSAGYCSAHAAALAETRRGSRIAALGRRWSPSQRALFGRASAAFAEYASSRHAFDCLGGTLQASCAIDGQESEVRRFVARVEGIAARTMRPGSVAPPRVDPKAAADWTSLLAGLADDAERANYRANRRETADGRRIFERRIVAFAASAWPQYSPHQVRRLFSDL